MPKVPIPKTKCNEDDRWDFDSTERPRISGNLGFTYVRLTQRLSRFLARIGCTLGFHPPLAIYWTVSIKRGGKKVLYEDPWCVACMTSLLRKKPRL